MDVQGERNSEEIVPMMMNNSSDDQEDEMMEEDLQRGRWTVEEDLALINYIYQYGEGRWNSLARSAGLKRTGKSCRIRWLNYLRPDVRRGNITLEEQLTILELHSRWGNRWSKIAQHLPGRTDNEIKNYWRTRILNDLPKYEDHQGIEYIRGTTRSRSLNMNHELQHKYEDEGQQGIEYIRGTARSMSINMNHELQQKHGDEGQQGIEYIRGTTSSMSVNMSHELLQKHGNEGQQEMEYIQETTRSHNELQQVCEYEGQQGMEYIQAKTKSDALYSERKQRHGYEDWQEIEYIRETTKSDVTMYF